MEQDSIVTLINRHFENVIKCLENNKNLDILMGFDVKSSKFRVDDNYSNPETEFAQRQPDIICNGDLKPFSDESFENFCSGKKQEERTDRYYSNERFGRNQFVKPQTPLLDYDNDEENDRKFLGFDRMRRSRKFIHSTPFSYEDIEEQSIPEVLCDEAEMRIITPRTGRSSRSIFSFPESESNFEDELEQYKKDVKIERAFESLTSLSERSYNDVPIDLLNYQSYSNLKDIIEPTTTKETDSQYETSFKTEFPVMRKKSEEFFGNKQMKKHTNFTNSPNIKSEFEDIFQNNMFNCNSNYSETPEFNLENMSDGFMKTKTEKDFESGNYILMNHLEIQKEMTKRIEDMYKSGDGK